jgi:ATP-dependent DNA ligase
MTSRLGKATYGSIGSYSNSEIAQLLSSYRKTVASYIPAGPEDIDRKLGISLLVSPKLDGELWYLLHDESWMLIAPNGRTIKGDIEILNDAKSLELDTSTIYAGELHIESETRTRIGDLAKALGEGDKLDTKKLVFGVFDVVSSPNLTAAGSAYSIRFDRIKGLPPQGNLFIVPTEKTTNSELLHSQFQKWVIENQFEGLVARSDDARTYKIKQSVDFDAAILGFTEKRIEGGEFVVRTVLVGLQIEPDTWVPVAAVGNIGDDDFRKELYQTLKPAVIHSTYRKTSESSGVMYQFVQPRLVVEIKALDLQSEDASGQKIKDPKLGLKDGTWRVIGWTNSVAVHNPKLMRLRPDKSVSIDDVGWDQLTRILPIETSSSAGASGKSEVIIRRVWTKDDSVRKLVAWKTNKESVGFSSYVVHWTDYSPGRKAPLAREVRLAPDDKTARKIADDMIAENIKKGWAEIS